MARAEVNITRTISGVEKTYERVVKRLGFQISTELIVATPVDTGWARANWIISIGQPHQNVAGSRDAISRGEQGNGQARLLVYRRNQGNIWISNNVPYIQALNDGHSKQAPAGYIEAAINTAVRKIIP